MKNILVISSSPRRNGNSDLLCDEFIKGALEAGNKVEKVFLGNKKIMSVLAVVLATIQVNVCKKMIWQN